MSEELPDGNARRPWPARTWVAIAIVLLAAFGSAITMVQSRPAPGPDVAAFERRMAPLRQALPAQGLVGYVSDTDYAGDGYMTQYALAPLVVYAYANRFGLSLSEPVLVIGNFSAPAAVAGVLDANDLVVTRDFGDGLLLLQPKAR
jgi:hypothetical protein